MGKFIEELKRRNVIKFAGIYVVAAWVLLQVSDVVVPAAGLPDWVITFVLYLMILGFPFALALSWMFDLTRKGVEPDGQDLGRQRFSFSTPVFIFALAVFAGATLIAYKSALPPPNLTPSIAVIPFSNLTGDRDRDFLSDGITEGILNQLFRLENLKVIARTSVFALKGQNLDLAVIGSRLNVGHILEGSLQSKGNKAKIAVRLISVTTGARLWAETFSGDLTDFEYQENVTNSVIKAVSKAFGQQPPPVARIATREVQARELYMRGRYYYEQRGEENMARAGDFFQQAIDIDPLYADAWAGLGQSFFLRRDDRALASAARALEFDPDNPRALILAATIAGIVDWEFDSALEQARRAVSIAPGDGHVRHFSANLLGLTGNFEASLAEQRIAARLDPLYPPALEGVGHRLRYLWRFEEAAEVYEQSLKNGFMRVNDNLFTVYGELGRIEDAAEATIQTNITPELDDWDRMMLAYYAGDHGEAKRIYESSFKPDRPPVDEAGPGAILDAVHTGDLDYAFAALNSAADRKAINLIRMLRSRITDELYADPRWVEFWQHPNMQPLFLLYMAAGVAPWIPIMKAAIADPL